MLKSTADRSAKRRLPSPNTTDYNEFEVPSVPLFSMPLTKSRKIIRFPYGHKLSVENAAEAPRPNKRVKWNKEPVHWRSTEGEFVDGTMLSPSSSSIGSDPEFVPSSDSDPDSAHGSPASITSEPDIQMLDGSPCSSKVELDLRRQHQNKRRFLSEPALFETIDWAVERTLKKKLAPHLNQVENMVVANSKDVLQRERERIHNSYEADLAKLQGEARAAKMEAKEKEKEIERLIKEREDGYWADWGDQGVRGDQTEEMGLLRVRQMFKDFRAKVWEFVSGSALQLETKQKITEVDVMRLPWVPDQQLFGNASVEVRRYLVMAAVFQVLYSRILRPGHRTFGAQVDEEVDEGGETRRLERHLEELEEYLVRQQIVGHKSEARWRAANINIFKQLREGVLAVEAKSAAQTLYGYLEPLMKFTFIRNKTMVKKMIEKLCEEALDLKLAIRKSPVPLRIETASRSTNDDGTDDEDIPDWEPRVDRRTGKPLIDPRWHEKKGQLKLTTEEQAASLASIKYIACIPFGALVRVEPGDSKVVVERAWVIGRA
ncbi:hypothetical protein B0T20DRAFT_349565 [Sordaria brevicollis]|uniref:Uncharacterized protein n=1 Tax=Sordaria brevicollis TaxID=83679 RepID=A0AAE0UDI0_SORBR|nr:hypothetical protein B0T20DRAFT_349565 [Sordaria brevicollis]